MARNQVTLTLAGDSANLEKTFGRVGLAAKGMATQIGKSGSQVGDAVKSAGRAATGAAVIAGAGLGAVMAVAMATASAQSRRSRRDG